MKTYKHISFTVALVGSIFNKVLKEDPIEYISDSQFTTDELLDCSQAIFSKVSLNIKNNTYTFTYQVDSIYIKTFIEYFSLLLSFCIKENFILTYGYTIK